MASLTEAPGESSSAVTGPDGSLSNQLDGAHAAVVDLGHTRRAVVDALATLGARIHVFGSRESSVEMLQTPVASTTVADAGVTATALAQSPARLLIISPGVPATGPILRGAAATDIETWSEVELVWRTQQDPARPHVPRLTLTGMNGKTTTISMLSAIPEAQRLTAPAVGNIGAPIIEAMLAGSAGTLTVELSSLQLHTTRTPAPLASAYFNLAADHLDWHGGLEAYVQDKIRVYSHTRLATVYDLADATTGDVARQADVVEGCRVIGFTLAAPGLGQVGMVENLLIDRIFHAEQRSSDVELATTADLAHLAPGRRTQNLPAHLLANALTAAALVHAAGADPGAVAVGLCAYSPGTHRIVTVAEAEGTTQVGDSKATDPHSAEAVLTSLLQGIGVWICGGNTKDAQFFDLVYTMHPYLCGAAVIGKNQNDILTALRRETPGLPVIRVSDGSTEQVSAAVVEATGAMARSGDTVMLAPARTSWDQFTSYIQRGDLFTTYTQAYTRGDDTWSADVSGDREQL